MQVSSKLLFRTALVLLGLMLAVTFFVAMSATQKANALNTSQWDTVRGYINSYFGGSQYNAADRDGEGGFRMGKVDLWNRLDSNGNIAPNAGAAVGSAGTAVTGVLGEGDDAANRPVLIDNLMTQTAIIPGTEFRCNWNVSESCFSDSSITAIRQIVDNHKAAGFSTDIVDYCVSSQTAGPSTGGFGIIAQVPGALSSDTSLIPRVFNVDYSRNGWRNSLVVANGTGAVAAPESASGFSAPGTVANCDASATDYELVRCQANWAISSTGGNVGNGSTDLAAIGGAGQSVDVRNGAAINTLSTAGTNLQVPINTLFTTSGLAKLDPTKTTVLASRTQMGATGAIGLRMLGYNLIPGGSINAGISRWNGAEGEDQVAYGDGLPLQTIAGYTAPGKVDITGPSVSSVAAENVGITSADIHRVAGEPATMKVEYGTTSGVYTDSVNNTVLNQHKTVSLTGLSGGTTYYYKATSYDGYANGTISTEGSFTTLPVPDTEDPVVTYVGPTGTISDDSPTVTGTATDNVGVVSASLSLNGGAATDCTVDGLGNVSCATSGLADGDYSALITATDAAGNTGTASGSFTVETVVPCDPAKPALSLSYHHAAWASYADYTARLLTVHMVMNNTGTTGAYSVAITGATATNGVTLNSEPPVALGDIAAGGSADAYLKYHVPTGVTGFRTSVTASANDACEVGYTYP